MPELKKSLSDISCMSMELFVPKRSQASDKECISMKSECGLNHRRLSIINGAGQKVGSVHGVTAKTWTKHEKSDQEAESSFIRT